MNLLITQGLGGAALLTLAGAVSSSPTQITVTFSTPLTLTGNALDPNRWQVISAHGVPLEVYDVSVVGATAVLDTDLQLGSEIYTVTCPNGVVNLITSEPLIAPFSATFTGTGGTPSILMARTVDATKLEVIFSMPVNAGDALNPSNYTISPTLLVTAVEKITPVIFRLTTSRQLVGVSYGVSSSGIRPGP